MTRKLEGHKINPANDVIDILVVDQPGSGGANHAYVVTGMTGLMENARTLITDVTLDYLEGSGVTQDHTIGILFQNGPIAEAGVNGLTHEVLLEILIDRIAGFQAGPFACQANADCLGHLKAAQEILLNRTRERMARGVEGTHAK